MAASKRPNGVADPAQLRDHLDAVDAAIQRLFAARVRLLDEVQDSFTGLRNSSQIMREIFYGVELPITSPQDLLKRAGGPDRIIRISYKETGTKVFALGDVIAAIPKFKRLFPVTSFAKLGADLEKLREDLPDTGPTWFATAIPLQNLRRALQAETQRLAAGGRSPLSQYLPVSVACGCCGAPRPPAALIDEAFGALSARPSAQRWTGKRPQKQPRRRAREVK